jgi:hypothetical protein
MQFHADQSLPPEQRQWLRCEVDNKTEHVCIVLARKNMLAATFRQGMGGASVHGRHTWDAAVWHEVG